MALTPEDVVNKRFQPTKFREGYDQDEVDDFLDEVVVELRRLGQENEELRQQIAASESHGGESQHSGASAAQQVESTVVAEPAVAEPAVAEPVVAASEPAPAAAYTAPEVDPLDPDGTNNLLQLARRLHEEHVRDGVQKRDALIADAQAQAQRIVQEAEAQGQSRAAEIEESQRAQFAELEETQRAQLGALDEERQTLETRVEELRSFEREYRQKLRSYIEGQLHDLDDANLVSAGATTSQPQPEPTPVFAAPASSTPPASYPGFAQN